MLCLWHFCVCIFLLLKVSRSIKDSPCVPPRGDTCVKLDECPQFARLLESTPERRKKLLWSHHCGFDDKGPKFCCFVSSGKTTTNAERAAFLPRTDCGLTRSMAELDNMVLRITRGSRAGLMEFPWMAILVFHSDKEAEPICGGTVINQRYVLTAAHCVVNFPKSNLGIRLGEHNMRTDSDCDNTGKCSPPTEDFNVEEVIAHAEYNVETKENDIALIRLATPANFSHEHIKPICLPLGERSNADMVGKTATIAGWGVTETGFASDVLLKTTIGIIPTEYCRKLSKSYRFVGSKQLCAGGNLGQDSCGGDSGGPLKYVTQEDGISRYVQYGIVSYGPKYCGSRRQPGVYTNVVSYLNWIFDNLRGP